MKWLVAVGIIILIVLLWIVRSKGHGEPEPVGQNESSEGDLPDDGIQRIDPSPLGEDYGTDRSNVRNDLEIVQAIVQDSQLVIKDFDRYFLPDNQAIVRFLQGNNRDQLAWLPKEHQFISDKGELLDRWGVPVFFHRESGLKFSVRSAGPDRKMWTDDDVSHGGSQTPQ